MTVEAVEAVEAEAAEEAGSGEDGVVTAGKGTG